MTRADLEHIIRAAGTIVDDDLIVFGSQAVLGEFPNAPAEVLISRKAEVWARNHPDLSDLIDGTIGEDSPFDRNFGYYAHGVGEETATLPEGWRGRLVLVCGENTRFVRGWCLEIHDLAVSKFVAGRPKDLIFTEALVRHGMIARKTIEERLAATALDPQVRELTQARVARQFNNASPSPEIG